MIKEQEVVAARYLVRPVRRERVLEECGFQFFSQGLFHLLPVPSV